MNFAMLRKKILIFIASIGMTAFEPIFAITGNQFLSLDEEKKFGYVMGSADQIWLSSGVVNGQREICFPEGNTFVQMLKIVEQYLSDHPEELHKQMPVHLVNALMRAFPC